MPEFVISHYLLICEYSGRLEHAECEKLSEKLASKAFYFYHIHHDSCWNDMEPCHLFLMAAKYNFMSHNIEIGSLVYLNDTTKQYDLWRLETGISKNDELESQVCVTSVDVYNTGEDTRGTADKRYMCVWCPRKLIKET